MTYKEWLSIWLENYVKPTAKMRTYERYSQIVTPRISFVTTYVCYAGVRVRNGCKNAF